MKDPEAALLGPLGQLSKSGGSESSSLSVGERGGGCGAGCRECWEHLEAWGGQKTLPWAETLRPGQAAGTCPRSQPPLQILLIFKL